MWTSPTSTSPSPRQQPQPPQQDFVVAVPQQLPSAFATGGGTDMSASTMNPPGVPLPLFGAAGAAAPITLFGTDQSTTVGNEAVPFRSTTYEPKFGANISSIPYNLLRGHMYVQDPMELHVENLPAALNWNTMPWAELYARGLNSFLTLQQKQSEVAKSQHMPTTPPDFDGEDATDVETVSRYICGMASAYAAHASTAPEPYELYQHMVTQLLKQSAPPASSASANNSPNLVNTPAQRAASLSNGGGASSMDDAPSAPFGMSSMATNAAGGAAGDDGAFVFDNRPMMSLMPTHPASAGLSMEVLNFSMMLSNPQNWTIGGLQHLETMLERHPYLASHLPGSVIDVLLQQLRDHTMRHGGAAGNNSNIDSSYPPSSTSPMFSVLNSVAAGAGMLSGMHAHHHHGNQTSHTGSRHEPHAILCSIVTHLVLRRKNLSETLQFALALDALIQSLAPLASPSTSSLAIPKPFNTNDNSTSSHRRGAGGEEDDIAKQNNIDGVGRPNNIGNGGGGAFFPSDQQTNQPLHPYYSSLASPLPLLPVSLVESFTLGPFSHHNSPSPMDVLHEDQPRTVSVALPEGVTVARFCVSHDETRVSFVASDGRVLLCDLKSWEVIEMAPNPNGQGGSSESSSNNNNGMCWVIQFSPDDQHILHTDASGRHHTMFSTAGLNVVQRFHFDEARIPRFHAAAASPSVDATNNTAAAVDPIFTTAPGTTTTTTTGVSSTTDDFHDLMFFPSPILPSGKSHVASLRFLASERMNFPLLHQQRAAASAAANAGPTASASSPNGPSVPQQPGGGGAADQALMDLGVVPQAARSAPTLTTDEFCLFTIVDIGFHGVVATIDTGDEILSLQLRSGIVTLVHGGGSCQVPATPHRGIAGSHSVGHSNSGWVMICASWKAGLWTLLLNGEVADLRGTRMSQSKSVQILHAYGLCGTGHIASVAGWCGPPTREILRSLVISNTLNPDFGGGNGGGGGGGRGNGGSNGNTGNGVRPLFHLPLDEGSGCFLKEMVSLTAIPVSTSICIWDTQVPAMFVKQPLAFPTHLPQQQQPRHHAQQQHSPHAPPVINAPRLPQPFLLSAHVHQSRFGIGLSYAPSHKGADGGCMIAITQDSSQVAFSYPDSTDATADSLFHINWEETKLFAFIARFGAFSQTPISSHRKRRETVDTWLQRERSGTDEDFQSMSSNSSQHRAAGLARAPIPVVGSVSWLAEQLHRVLFIEGTQLLRFPAALSPINARNMVTVCAALRHCTRPGTPKIKTLALLTLGAVHFRYLSRPESQDRGVVQSVATMLNVVCKQLIAEHSNDAILSKVASELFHVGVSKSLTPIHKAEVLAEVDTKPHSPEIIESYLARDSIGPIVEHLCHEDPAMLKRIAGSLLRYCDSLVATTSALTVNSARASPSSTPHGGSVVAPPSGSCLAASHMLWFAFAVVNSCTANEYDTLLKEILEIFIDYALGHLRRLYLSNGGVLPQSAHSPPQNHNASSSSQQQQHLNNTQNVAASMSSLSQDEEQLAIVIGGSSSPNNNSASSPTVLNAANNNNINNSNGNNINTANHRPSVPTTYICVSASFDSLKLGVIHTGVVPLLIAVAQLAPQIVDDSLRRKLSDCLRFTTLMSGAATLLQSQHSTTIGKPFSNSINEDDAVAIDPPSSSSHPLPPRQNNGGSLSSLVVIPPPPPTDSEPPSMLTISNTSAWTGGVSPTPPAAQDGSRSSAFARPTLHDGSVIGRQPRTPTGNRSIAGLEQQMHRAATPLFASKSPVSMGGMPPSAAAAAVTTVTFSTRQASDIVPAGPSAPWRLLVDVSFASYATFTRETAASDITIIQVGTPSSTKPMEPPHQDQNTEASQTANRPSPTTTAPPLDTVGKRVLTASSPTIKVVGGRYLLCGAGEASLTTVCQYALEQSTDYRIFLRDAIFRALIAVARHCLVRPPPSDLFLAPLFRHGLMNKALERHNIHLETDRVPEQTLALEVLRGEGGGKEIVDTLVRAMRGVLTSSMRPAVQALLAILIHSGVAPTFAQEEVKSRWFSGEWGSKLQGENKDAARESLVSLAEWIILNVSNTTNAGCTLSPIRRSSASDRRVSDFLGRSMARASLSTSLDRRNSTSSLPSGRRSTSKSAVSQNEVLEQVRALFNKGTTTAQLEQLLVARTEAAITITRGLAILAALVAPEGITQAYRGASGTSRRSVGFSTSALSFSKSVEFENAGSSQYSRSFQNNIQNMTVGESCSDKEYGLVLDAMSQMFTPDPQQQQLFSPHLIEGLVGCGGELEMAVRREFHVVIAAAGRGLLEDTASRLWAPNPQIGLCAPVAGGVSVLKLMWLLCHPWDSNDCDFLMQRASEVASAVNGTSCKILGYLQELSQLTTNFTSAPGSLANPINSNLANPSTITPTRPTQPRMSTSSHDEDALLTSAVLGSSVAARFGAEATSLPSLSKLELTAIADESSLSCIFPNHFGAVVPGTQISRSEGGVLIERVSGQLTLRADEAWPLEWCEGMPRVYYFEATLLSPAYRVAICLAQSRGPSDGGPGGRQAQDTGGMLYSYGNTGAVSPMNDVGGPPFHEGDTIGCGIVSSTRRVFYTLNGVFLGFSAVTIDERLNKVYPALTLETQDAVRLVVNFGTQSFLFDFRQLHPSLLLPSKGPSSACIASAAASVLHVMTARACSLSDLRRVEARNFFLTCNNIVCGAVRKITENLVILGAAPASALANTAVVGGDQKMSPAAPYSQIPSFPSMSPASSSTPGMHITSSGHAHDLAARAQTTVRIALAERQILKVLATLKHLVGIVNTANASVVQDDVSESVFKAVTTLLQLPLQSVKMATISLLPDVLPLAVRQVKDGAATAQLVRSLFELAKSKIQAPLFHLHRHNTPPGLNPQQQNHRLQLQQQPQQQVGGTGSAASSPSGSAYRLSPQTPTTLTTTHHDTDASEGGIREQEEAPKTVFSPGWQQCDTRCMTIVNTHHARMAPETQRSIVLGTVLPRTGTVSFTIRITREGMTKGHSLKGGYFVGVALATLAPLSPPSNSQSWKVVKPPIVWALHDTSPQLPHAVNPTVRPNNFQRTFGSGDIITVVVNRDAQSVAFYRDNVFLKELYQDVPQGMELAPFAQLYNDDASVDLGPGYVTPPITSQMLLSAAAVDVLQSMFSLHPFDDHVARHLTEELDNDPWPAVTLAVFASLPDPRALTLRHSIHEETAVVVRRVHESRCKFTVGGVTYYDHVCNLRTPALPTIRGKLDANFAGASVTGMIRCIEAMTRAWARLTTPLVTTNALEASERLQRRGFISEERAAWDSLFTPRRLQRFDMITTLTKSSLREVSRSPPVPLGYAFSQPLSHPGFVLSPRYCGRLITVPNGSANTATPFIAIAEPSIPSSGRFSIRCQLIRGHHGQILGGGYYFGVCAAASFTWKRREMNVTPPDVWALHDMEDAPWRLRHLTVDRRLPTAAEPNCLLVSGDIVRLEIDRDEGTVHAYRKPVNSSDELFIGFLYDNLPKNAELFPFVHMYNTDAVAVILPSSPSVPAIRTTLQQPHFALCLNEKRNCDGCVSQHRETKLSNANQEWFKCNDCVDYNLCGYCFGNFVHSHHPFTRMDGRLLVHTRLPPMGKLQAGATLVAPGTSVSYLKSIGCTMPEDAMSCVAVSAQPESMCTWGLIYSPQEDPSFTVNVKINDSPAGTVLSTNRPVFIGVGEASEILGATVEDLRKRCVTGFPTGVSMCSDSRVRRKLNFTSVSPHGFLTGSTITITVQLGQGRARLTRDWIDVGFVALPPNINPNSKLVGFVLFGSPNMTASVAPERAPHTLVTVVETISNELIRVSDSSNIHRFCSLQDCRVPMMAESGTPKVDMWYYAFLDNRLTTCRVAMVDKGEAVVFFPKRDSVQRVPTHHLFYPIFGDVPGNDDFVDYMDDDAATCGGDSSSLYGAGVAPSMPAIPTMSPNGSAGGALPNAHQTLITASSGGTAAAKSSSNNGPATMMDGFVMSRLMVILSCLMEDASLVPLLLTHAQTVLPLLHRLASVRIDSDAPTSFLPELRAAVASTTQVPRTQRLLNKPLAPFVPTTTPELEKTHAFPVKPNMLVAIIDGPLKGKLFRAQGAGTDTFRAEPLDGGAPATIKAAACVPVKQTAGRPWWRVSGGLPSSVLEHTLRSEVLPMHTNAKLLVSAEGEWHGELITAQNSNMSMSLSLRVDAMNWQITGTARVTIPDGRVIETAVRGTHHRYARTMRLACSYPTAGPHMTNDELRVGLRTFGVQATQEATRDDMIRKLASLCSHLPQPCWTLRGSVDAEGLRMSGTWKHTEGLSGTFSISSLRAVTLSALTTPFYHIEPLPNCVDMPIAAPQARDVYTVMHRLIVLLARHLYVSLIGRSGELAKEISKEIIHYHAHPLTERIIAFCVDTQPQRFYRILGEAITLMMDPKATPWDSSTLSAIITKSILLRPSTSATMPSVIWDALHAVVAAAHNCGEDHRHKVLDNVIQLIRGMAAHPPGGFLEDPTLPPPSLVGTDPTPTADLLTALCTWVDTQASTIVGIAPVRRDVAAGIELLLTIAEPLANRVATSVPLPVLRCLMDMAVSIQHGVPLPWAAEASSSRASADAQLPTLEVLCPFGQLMDGELKVGKVMSNLRTVSPHSGGNAATGAPPSSPQPPSKYYFEVVLPERTLAAFAVGWGTQQHSEIPSQHVGSDLHSFAFSGAQVVMKQVKEEYKFGVDIAAGAVVGCLLDLTEKMAAWSINGVVGPFIPVPILVADYDMHAYASTGSCSGLKIHMSAMEFLYVPDGYCDLAGRTSGVQVVSFDATRRSTIPVRPMSFYTHVASYLSDVEQALSSNLNSASSAAANSASAQQPPPDGGSAGQQTPSSTTQAIATPAVDSVANVATSPSSAGTAATAAAIGGGTHNAIPSTSSVQHQHHQPQLLLPPHVEAAIRGRYSQLMSLTDVEISQCVSVIRVAESCMTTARRFIDLEGESVEGRLASAFLYMKQLVTRSFRRKLVEIPQVENNKSYNPPNATIRFTDLSSTFSRSNETALHHTILAQLHRQIGSFTPKQMLQNPMVRVHLYMTQSGHAPQDLGGPYRQMWSLLGDEMMTHPDSCYPHTDFHRNPLFRFANNSQRISLVPDHLASSSLELHLFTFLGKLMGHMARARSPLPVDISPFVWKFLVEDPLNVRDYYQHVDSVVEQSVNDEEFLRSEVAEDVIPNYADAISRETELYQIQQFQLQQQQHQQAHNAAAQQHHHPFAPFGPQGSGTASAASSGSGIRALVAGHGGVVAAVLPTTNNTMGSMLASHQQTNNASRSDISLIYEDPDEAAILPFAVRRRVAEECLTHCMDLQLTALRTGLWSTLPKRVTRCLCWQDLERSVCGDASPTLEQMRDAVIVQAQHLREQFFWRLVEEMTGAQRSALLCFACGQKRLPLVKKVRVIENTESLEHLPRAQSCSALVTIPCYTSYDVFRAKVLSAIEHQSEMELA